MKKIEDMMKAGENLYCISQNAVSHVTKKKNTEDDSDAAEASLNAPPSSKKEDNSV